MENLNKLPKTRKEAQLLGLKYYFTRKPCKNGHIDKRLICNSSCYTCSKDRRKIYCSLNKAKESQNYKQWWLNRNIDHKKRKYNLNLKWRKENVNKSRRSTRMSSIKCYSEELYELNYKKQNGKCAICGTWKERLHRDHCHKENIPRGLLCGSYNRGIGLLKDNLFLLKQAVKYLEQYNFKKESV